MSTNTITSLAMLKVSKDQGIDYLDHLRPFVLQILSEHGTSEPVFDETVSLQIQERFGLIIPGHIVQVVLMRFAKLGFIDRKKSAYWVSEGLPDPKLKPKQSEAKRHIDTVVTGLMDFSRQKTASPVTSVEKAVNTVCSFLAEFSISCLRAYLRETAIPPVRGRHPTDIVLVSDYVQHLRERDPNGFESFLILLQGHMIANALMCPDLQNLPREYLNVTFYLDTPLLIRILGCEAEVKRSAASELIALLKKLNGKVAAFSHTRDELKNVLIGSAAHLDSPDGRGGIIFEARQKGTTKSDLLLLAETVDERLSEAGIEVEETPPYLEPFQINETVFEQVLESEVEYYHNPRAKDYDINSVRSIYVKRSGKKASSLEDARAIFVTSNTSFAKAAWQYGQNHESSQDVSSVITDFSLANITWLKVPMQEANIPTTQLLAFSYASLQPSSELLSKYLQEIEKLETSGIANERALQVLRSGNHLVYSELMHLTLGEDDLLTETTTLEIFERVSEEIRKEETEKLTSEQKAHEETQDALDIERFKRSQLICNILQQCRKKAIMWARVFSGILVSLLLGGLVWESLERPNSFLSWVLAGGLIGYILLAFGSLVTGVNVVNIHAWVKNWLLKRFLKSDAARFGIELEELDLDKECRS